MKITKAGVHKQAATHSVWPVDATLVCPKCDCEFTLERDDIQGEGAYRVYRSRNLITGGAARPMLRGLCPDCYHDIEIMGPLPTRLDNPGQLSAKTRSVIARDRGELQIQ